MSGDAIPGGSLRGWPFRVAVRRLLRQRRLLLLVVTVAVLAATAVTSVGLLITATERSAIRTSLKALPQSAIAMSVDVEQPNIGLAETTKGVDQAVHSVLGQAAAATRTERAYSALAPIDTPRSALALGPTSLAYFAELEGVARHVAVTSGALPTTAPSASSTTVRVAVPVEAARRLGLQLGSTFPYSGGARPVILEVVGIYSVSDPGAQFWSQDPLRAAGIGGGLTLQVGDQSTLVDGFGPLLVASGTLDEIGTPADRVEIDYSPNFQRTDVSELQPLIGRLANAGSAIPSHVGDIGNQVTYSGNANVPLEQIAAALTVTRSTVVVVTLLLLVLSIAALAQAARLFNDARSGDRELMRARGASRGQLLSIAFLEAGVVGIVTAAVSAPLARLVYLVIATQPAMVSAGVPADSGLPGDTWLTSAVLGLLFIIVLLLSLLGHSGSFLSAEQTKSRQRRVSGILRSGLDLGIVVVAVIAFWQLAIYRSPVNTTGDLSVDPVLVAAPALVLLAGSLLAARLFPLLARLVGRWGERSRGVLFRLASWEISRRSGRATAVVLLLTLSLAVGTFGQTFLATWRQSQVDQADYAVGPPVRVPAIAGEEGAQLSTLRRGASEAPQPVIRRVADVDQDAQNSEDADAEVLGLTPGARAMLDRGQLAVEGGSTIASALRDGSSPAHGIVLPGDPAGISAVAEIGNPDHPLPGVDADIQAMVQDHAGLLTTVDLGTVPVDGKSHEISGMLAALPRGVNRALPLQFVGLLATVNLYNQALYRPNPEVTTNLLFGQLAALEPALNGTLTTRSATASSRLSWSVGSPDPANSPARRITVNGWRVGLAVTIPADVETDPGVYSATAWSQVEQIPVVVSQALASALQIKTGDVLDLDFANAAVRVEVMAVTDLIPASVDAALLTASAAAGADSTTLSAVVMDQSALQRALVQGGTSGSMVDEWWVDVPAGTGQAYINAHRSSVGADPARSSEVLALQMQQDPLRVATQAALWLAIAAAALVAAIGFAVHSASTLASRRIELAQLRAIGLSRGRVVALIGAESLLLCALGVFFGLMVGLLLGWLAGPLIALSPDGAPAVPPVRVIVPWLQLVLLVLAVVAVLIAVVAAVAGGQRSANPANILREADNG